MNLKKGTPGFGILCGAALAAAGALVMTIGFWKALVLCLLFALGYFLGTVENKKDFMKNTANRLIPEKDVKVIDFKSEVKREQEVQAEAAETEEKE